ncbi:MAG: sigma-70 family RNA polymerase sigma factor [Chloroflexota bacterium]
MSLATVADANALADYEHGPTAVATLDDQQEPLLAEIIHSARRSGSELRFAVVPLQALHRLPIFPQLARTSARSQSYLVRAARQWTRRGGSVPALLSPLGILAEQLAAHGRTALAGHATRLAVAVGEALLTGALELDRQLRGPSRQDPAARAFLQALDQELTALTAAYPPSTLEQLDVEAARRAARDYFIRAQLSLAVRRARKVAHVSRIPLADLIQTGVEGLIHAVDRFDPSFGAPFAAYGYTWIKQQIARAESQAGAIQLPQRMQAVRSDTRRALLGATEDGSPTRLAAVAQRVNRPQHVVEAILRVDAPVLSLDGATGHILAESRTAEGGELDEELLLDERCRAVRAAMVSCTAQGRVVLERLYGIGCPRLSGPQIARALGISSQRVYEIRDAEVRRLRRPPVAIKLIAAA